MYTRCTPHFLVYSTYKFLNRIKELGAEKVSCALALLYSRDKCAETKEIVVVHPLLSYGEGAHLERAPLLEAREQITPGALGFMLGGALGVGRKPPKFLPDHLLGHWEKTAEDSPTLGLRAQPPSGGCANPDLCKASGMISRRDFLAGLAATAVLPPLLAARASEPKIDTQAVLDRMAERVVFGVDWAGDGTDHTVMLRIERDANGISTVERVPEEQWRMTATEVNQAQQEMRRKFLRNMDDAFLTIRDAPAPTHFRGFSA